MSEPTKEYFDKQFEQMATAIKVGFDNTATKQDIEAVTGRLGTLETKIDKIDERLQIVEAKLDRALYTEYIRLEARVKRLEEKVGIKSS